jgi:hypothetical protein
MVQPAVFAAGGRAIDYRQSLVSDREANYDTMSADWGNDDDNDDASYGTATGVEAVVKRVPLSFGKKAQMCASTDSSIDVDREEEEEGDFDSFVLPVVSPTPQLTRRDTMWSIAEHDEPQPLYDAANIHAGQADAQPLYDAANVHADAQPLYDEGSCIAVDEDDTVVVYDNTTDITTTTTASSAAPITRSSSAWTTTTINESHYDAATAGMVGLHFDLDHMGSRSESRDDYAFSPVKSPSGRDVREIQLPGAPDEDDNFYDSTTGPSALAAAGITDIIYDAGSAGSPNSSPRKWGKEQKRDKTTLPVPPPRAGFQRGNSFA